MAKKKSIRFTRFELEIMEPLWKLGRASVREVQEALPEKRQPAYTTIQTIIRRLEEKGAVRHVRKIGNAHIYEPAVSREAAQRKLVSDFLEMFGGSVRPLMSHLIESGKLSLEDLRELEDVLEKEREAQAEKK